ncbi:hypothetical protein BATDEDRAFT_21005 [Batrachochytrium dendrobatidis JAM81]|uniref:Uncharacterized protein n=2 Tax=Batrachochytrium dendrobatidis TaxID=109871 RepID=F4PDC9_BATDJ|nr:uncharacterized protein BATDEDRAFT_21005 [Batrachochytrium dendrobatidis JAM81]EGF76767.1 hypothetical protein BATDEDRAFT_21005 [Batrachochytrium dendrobatidis JAM81]KAK5670048.1 kinetochore-associated Ndc80 complex subunit nuf2 [Batrachochytrium dendrobatidis]OAJ45285.1 hypothetical protein BDEG_28435 [Batrachochytrium dendrobatidis JEL423]|eukprot:XP_006682575.1 hypothetical protein BATDEDRAFT_21005 [Batrachochytrium dendrobatidis JAM81]
MDEPLPAARPGSFPILSLQTLKDCLNGLDMQVTVDDLAKPTPQKMLEIYESLTVLLQGVSSEQFAQPTFAVLELLEYPDVHKDSLGLVAFYRHLHKLVTQLGYPAFSLGDVLNPKRDRVQAILSGFINFCKFREERMEVFQECCTKSTQLTEERLMLERRNAELAETVNQIKMKRAQDQPQVDGIRAINTSLAADLRELKKTQVTLASKIDHLKKEKNACTEKQTNNQFLISNLKQNCVRLKSRVVHSPEKLKQVIAEMNRSLQEDKTYVVHTEKKNRELTHKIELMNAVEQDIIMCQNIMGECTTEQARAEEASQKLLSDIDVINKKKSELKDQEVHRQQLQRQLKNANEKLQRLEQHRVSKEQDTASRINALKEEHEILAAERDVAQKRVDDHERLVVDMEDKIKQLQKNMDSELFAIASDYELLIRETELYQQGLINAMF